MSIFRWSRAGLSGSTWRAGRGPFGDGESQKSGWLEGGRTLCVGPYVIRRFVGDSQTGRTTDRHEGEPPLRRALGRAWLTATHRYPRLPWSFSTALAVDVLAGTPGDVVDRIGQRLQVPAHRCERFQVSRKFAADLGGFVDC